MRKVLIYHYKAESLAKTFGKQALETPHNLSGMDVDYGAKPKEGLLHNWIQGTKTEFYTEFTSLPIHEFKDGDMLIGSKTMTFTRSRQVPCLKAIVEVDGIICEYEKHLIQLKPST